MYLLQFLRRGQSKCQLNILILHWRSTKMLRVISHFMTRVYTWQWLFKIFYRPTQYAFLHEGIKQIYHHFNHYLNQSKVTFVWVTIHVFRLWNNSSLKWWQRITKVFTTCIYCTSSFECICMFRMMVLNSL